MPACACDDWGAPASAHATAKALGRASSWRRESWIIDFFRYGYRLFSVRVTKAVRPVIFATRIADVQRARALSVRLPADEAAQQLHQRARLNGSKLAGVEELAVAERTRLVPDLARAPAEHATHRRVTARTIHAPLIVATGFGLDVGRIERVNTLLRTDIPILERVEPQAFARRAAIDFRRLDP